MLYNILNDIIAWDVIRPFPGSNQGVIQVLFGDRRQELYRALARALIELVVEKSPKPLVLGTSVKRDLGRGWQPEKNTGCMKTDWKKIPVFFFEIEKLGFVFLE